MIVSINRIYLSTWDPHKELTILKPASGLMVSVWARSMVAFQIVGTKGMYQTNSSILDIHLATRIHESGH